MAFDLALFSDKLQRYCMQFEVDLTSLSQSTGITVERLHDLVAKKTEPTGDEILILADFFKCDFKFFISNERLAAFEQTESLFRKNGKDLNRADRWSIQEFLFLCDCQQYLLTSLQIQSNKKFSFTKCGTLYKTHGQEAANALRIHQGYKFNEVPRDVYEDFRKIGIHIFRRKLGQSAISGIFIKNPVAGPCVLVNYSEDVFRQRFTAAHEVAHAILDDSTDFVVSYAKWEKKDLSEIRANAFASHYLMPPEFLRNIPDCGNWNNDKIIEWSVKLMVNPEPLIFALLDAKLIKRSQMSEFKNIRIPNDKKNDPELSRDLSIGSRQRKEELLQRGLSDSYVKLCFEGYEKGTITSGRLAEMLLVSDTELYEIAGVFNKKISYGD